MTIIDLEKILGLLTSGLNRRTIIYDFTDRSFLKKPNSQKQKNSWKENSGRATYSQEMCWDQTAVNVINAIDRYSHKGLKAAET